MGITTSYGGTIEYIRNRRPTYLLGYGGGITLALIILFVSLDQGWFGFVNIAFAGLLVFVYFFIASLWAAHKLYDGSEIIDLLFEVGEWVPDQRVVYIDLGLKKNAVALSRRFTTGRVIVIDVYNPQLTPARWLSRATQRAEQPEEDPRIEWKGGSVDLLPLPDQGAPVVVLLMTASEFWQEGDRVLLLNEISRVITEEGSLLIVERVRTLTNWLVMGPAAIRMPNASYWRSLLIRAGFTVTLEKGHHDMLCLFAAERSS
jgi:hypothetical protein